MSFAQVPPDTSTYMIAGYTIFFVVTAIYVVSLFLRTRNLNRDLETLEGVQEEQERAAPVAASTRRAPRTPQNATRRASRTGTAKKNKPKQGSRKGAGK